MQDQFVEHYENSHAPLARSILEFSHYERNHILNLSTGDPSCISIFKYSSEELLKKTQKILQDYPKELKEDELKFMDFDKNYYHFVYEKISSLKKFKYKVFSKNENIILESKDNWREIISHLRTSSSTLASISKDLIPYFLDIQTYDQKSVEKFIIGSKPTLEFVFRQLELIEAWNEDQLDDALTKCQRDLDLKTPQLNQPIRVALVGTTKSPSLGLTLSLVGKEVALARIKKAIELNDQE